MKWSWARGRTPGGWVEVFRMITPLSVKGNRAPEVKVRKTCAFKTAGKKRGKKTAYPAR